LRLSGIPRYYTCTDPITGVLAALSPRSADGRAPCPRLRMLEVRWKCGIDLGELVHLVDLTGKRIVEGSSLDDICVAGSVVRRSST